MLTADYLPHVKLLLDSMRVNRERLNSKSKIAIEAKLLRTLLQMIILNLPFSVEFYKERYPDLAEAHTTGQIPDLHRHFIESGYFEGRLGAAPPVDETFYTELYPDVAAAVEHEELSSGAEHYMRAGAAEGRVPNAGLRPTVGFWNSLLRDDPPLGG